MTQKTLVHLTVILFLGIALVIGRDLWQRYRQGQPNDYLRAIQAFDSDAVNKVLLSQNSKTLQLIKEESSWKVGTKSADPSKIEDILKAFFPEQSPLQLSESESLQADLGIGSDETIAVTLNAGDAMLSLRLGKQTPSARAVALAGQTQTYGLTNVPFLSLDATDWYDDTIVDIDSKDITKITFAALRQADSFVVEQTKENEWKFVNSEEKVNHDAVNTFTFGLNPLLAQELAFEQKQKLFNQKAKPALSLTIETTNQQQTKLDFYKGRSDYLVKRSPNEEYFVLSNQAFADLETKKVEFVAVEEKQ